MKKGTNWKYRNIYICIIYEDCIHCIEFVCHLGVSMRYLTDRWNDLRRMTHHEDQDNDHGDAGQTELPLPQGIVASPDHFEECSHRFYNFLEHFTSEQQQDNPRAYCILPCSSKTEGSREEQRQRRGGPRGHRPGVSCGQSDREVRISAHLDKRRVVSPLRPDQAAALLSVEVVTRLLVSSCISGNANNLF